MIEILETNTANKHVFTLRRFLTFNRGLRGDAFSTLALYIRMIVLLVNNSPVECYRLKCTGKTAVCGPETDLPQRGNHHGFLAILFFPPLNDFLAFLGVINRMLHQSIKPISLFLFLLPTIFS
jgi:hypothetical protein